MFTENLDDFIDSQEFGICVDPPNGTLFQAVFDNEHLLVDYGDGRQVSTRQPQLTCKTVDASRLEQEDILNLLFTDESGQVTDTQTWKIKDIQHDGTGMTVVELYQ